jgi:hypothetical protein
MPFPITPSFSMVTTPPGENSGLPVRASFDGFSHRSSRKSSIGEDAGPFNRFLLPTRPPFGAELQQDQSSCKESACKKEESSRILPGSLLDGAENKRQKKAAQAARSTDQSGKKPDAFWESLRQELKNSSIPHAHHSHGEKQERYLHWKHREPPYTSEANRHAGQQQQEQAVASDLVREPPTHGPKETSRKDNDGREVTGAHF